MPVPTVYRKPKGTLGVILPQAPIESLVFEGGGPKGLVYIGALEVLEERGMTAAVRNVGGASAGAMTALAVGLGFTAAQTREIVEEQKTGDLTDLTDDDGLSLPEKAFQVLRNLFGTSELRGQGLFRGEKLHAWIKGLIHRRVTEAERLLPPDGETRAFWEHLIAERGNITFGELARLGEFAPALGIRSLAFTGTNYTDRRLEVFSAVETPDMPVALAVRISVSLPWFFKSVKYNGKEYIDGGCLANFPMWIFDRPAYRADFRRKVLRGAFDQNLATLGFKVDSTEEIRRILWDGAKADDRSSLKKVWDDLKEALLLIATGVNTEAATKATDKAVYGKYAQRTVQIPDLDYSAFNFSLSEGDKASLRQSGVDATTEWLSIYYEDAGIEVEIFGMSELADYLSAEDFLATCAAYPDFLDPDAKGTSIMPDNVTPFDPKSKIYDGISVLSTNDWIEMTTFFDNAVISNPTSEAMMRQTLTMQDADEFRPEFADAVGLYQDLKKCGELFKQNVQEKMLGLADDIVQYNDACGVTYDRLIELVNRFDWDGAPEGATPDDKWAALVEVWNSGAEQGRSEQIRDRFASALDTLIEDAESRADQTDALQLSILAPDGILARLKTSRKGFVDQKERFEAAFGSESTETTALRKSLETLQEQMKSLQKKEKDEIIVLGTSAVYLVIPLFGPFILAAVDIGVGVDLALTRETIAAKVKEVESYRNKIVVHERFNGYHKTVTKDFDTVIGKIGVIEPKIELMGKAWRAVASDLAAVRKLLSVRGKSAIEGENWYRLVTVLDTAKAGWHRIALQADRFRIFGGTPMKQENVADLVDSAAQVAT